MSENIKQTEIINHEKTAAAKRPFLFAVSGVKNSGKTTLVERLIPALIAKGLSVATIKHDGHDFEADVPGTDSYRHFAAGAIGSVVYSGTKFSLVKRAEGVSETELARFFPEADVILLEGFKGSRYPKIEIVRKGNSELPVCDPDTVVAIASDFLTKEALSAAGWEKPIYSLEDIEGMAECIRKTVTES